MLKRFNLPLVAAVLALFLAAAPLPSTAATSSTFATFSVNPGGSKMAFNITAIGQIKNSSGRLRRLFVITAASAGTLAINDVSSAGTAAAGNQIAAIPNTALTAGVIITVDAPCANGITISGTWPTGLVLAASYD